jgi:chromosome segregation ATPase
MEASTAVSSRLIGAFFVEKGLVTQEQLDQALQKQAESGERLGEIIVAEFGVSRLELASVLAEQWAEFERDTKARDAQAAPEGQSRLAVPEPVAAPVEPQLRRPIGEIFLERGFVTPDDLDRALDVQRETGARLGEVLVEQGSLSRLDLASALAEQWSALQKLRPPEPVEPQPWQNGTPETATGQADIPPDLRRSLEELTERVRAVEHSYAATPWNEDLRLLGENVRAAIHTVEERVTKAATQVDPAQLEALGAALDELRERIEAPSARLDSLEQRFGELPPLEELEARLESRLAELRAAVDEARADPGSPSDEYTGLRDRLDELAARTAASEQLEELRAQVAALAAAPAPAEEIAALRSVVEELSAGVVSAAELEALRAELKDVAGRVVTAAELHALQQQVEEVASRVVAPEALAEVRDELAALAGRPSPAPDVIDELRDRIAALAEQVAAAPAAEPELAERLASVAGEADAARAEAASLARRVEELGAHVQEIETRNTEPSGPRLREILDGLQAEIGSLAQRPAVDVDAVEGRLSALEQRRPDPALEALAASVEEQRARIDGRLDELAGRASDTAAVDELRSIVGELAGRVAVAAEAESVELRLGELERRLADTSALDDIRAHLHRLAESAATDRAAVEQALHARIEQLVASVPATGDVAELRLRVEELAQRPAVDDGLRARLDDLGGRVEQMLGAVESQEELRQAVAELQGSRTEEAAAIADRLARAEAALGAVEGVEWRLQTQLEESLAVRASELEHRLESATSRLEVLDSLEERIALIRADLASYPGGGAFEELVSAVRTELGQLADRLEHQERALAALPEPPDPTPRLDDLALRLDAQARLTAERLGRLGDDVRGETAAAVSDVSGRIDEIDSRLGDVAGRDEVRGSIAEHAAEVAAELERIRRASAEHEQALAERLSGFADRAAVEQSLGELRASAESARAETSRRVEESMAGLRHELESRNAELGGRVAAQEGALAAIRSQLEELQAAAAGQGEWREQVEGTLNARLEELRGLRQQDLGAARAANDALASRVDELQALRGEDADAARAAADDLRVHMGSLVASLRDESAAAVAAADQVVKRVDGLEGQRSDDLEAARVAGAELVARLDDLAIRTAAAAAEAERALRSELHSLAATVEEKEAAGIEAGDELRLELERAASSMGWRLERIEEALAADDRGSVREAVAELERRLEQQNAQREEQVRVTERALRKGLASLGERLADTQTAYVDAGNALRRSIERLGAAVVEADARMADQIPVSEVEGYVAFAPTSEGYRLVQVPGRPPELGATVEIDGIDGPLVVTRFGRSPLPLDSRPCAYLDRAT